MTSYVTDTQTKNIYHRYYYRATSCEGSVPVEKYRTQPVHRTTNRNPVRPDTRVKPTDLIAAMTSRGPLYRKVEEWRLDERVTSGAVGCPGASPGEYLLVEQVYTQPYNNSGYIDTLNPAPSPALAIRKKIKGVSVNMAENIGEFRETVDLVTATGHNMVSSAKTVYNKLPRKIRRKIELLDVPAGILFPGVKGRKRLLGDPTWRDIPSSYLGASFAVVPLLGGVHDAMVGVGRNANAPIRRRFRATSRGAWTETIPGTNGGSVVQELSQTKTAICYVTYDPGSLTDWTAGNPAEALWAATPFSWVVDYFLQVGDWLSGLDACRGVTLTRYCETKRNHVFIIDTRCSLTGGSMIKPGVCTLESYNRTAGGSVPMPTLPEWKPSGSWRKLSYLAAVLVGLRSRN